MEELQDLDYILENIVGGGGWWQWRLTLILYPTMCAAGFPLFLDLFGAFVPKHRCKIEGCDPDDINNPSLTFGTNASIFDETYLSFTTPRETASGDIFTTAEEFDSCKMYKSLTDGLTSPVISGDLCVPENFDKNETMNCVDFVYARNFFKTSLSTELNLVCDEAYKKQLLGTIMMLGLLVGSIIGGRISDRFGRKIATFGSVAIITPTVIIGGYSTSYEMYAVLRFITCTALPVSWVAGSAYNLEIWSPGWRRITISVRDFPIAQFFLCFVVYLCRDWTSLHLAIGIFCGVGLIPYWFVPESPRWLIMHGKKDEAEKVFLDMAAVNGKTVESDQLKTMRSILDAVEGDSQVDNNLNFFDMFRRDTIIKSIIIFFAWIMVCLGYYALTLNSTKLAGDPILNYFLATAADMPVSLFLFLTLDRIGRRGTMALTHTILGVSCLVLAFMPKTLTGSILGVYLVGKCAAGAGFNMVYLYTGEIFPTNLRSQAIGLCSMMARIFCLCAPFLAPLSKFWQPLPMFILGVPTVISGCLSLLLPETSGKDLPQTMKEAEGLEMYVHHDIENNNKHNK